MSKKRILGTGLTILLVFTMLFVMAGPNLLAAQVASNPGNAAFPGNEKIEVLIGFQGPPKRGLVEAFGGEVYAEFTIVDVIAAQMTQQQAKALAQTPLVSYVELDAEVHAIAQDVPWGIDRVFGDETYSFPTWISSRGSGIGVAVLDTGIDTSHEDLTVVGGRRFYLQGLRLRSDSNYNDVNGHGTHVAGTIAALDNYTGVVGVAPAASLYAVKVLGDNGSGSVSAIVAGIEWVVAQKKISIINMSLGSSSYSQTFKDACDAAYDGGILVISSAGNSGNTDGTGDNVGYPARYDSVIAVAASNSSDQRASFSSTGYAVELIAPGVAIKSTVPGGYATYNGTSMASPHVAGVAALVWAAKPSLTNVQVRAILQETAQTLNLPVTHQGEGLVRADLAVDAVAGPADVPVTGVSIVEGNREIEVNKTVQLSVTIEPANATNQVVSWSSTNENVASVSSDGLVTGIAAGTATITVTTSDGGFTDTVGITVNATSLIIDVESVSINEEPPTIEEGKTVQLSFTIEPANATNQVVSWSSINENVASVSSDGLVTGVSAGTATITVTTEDGGKTATVLVTVTEKPVGELTALNVAIKNPAPNSSYTWNSRVDIAVQVTDQNGYVVGGADVTVTIKKLNSAIILATYNGTSNAEGIFTALYRVPNKAEIADYTITASAKKDGVSSAAASVTFKVTGR